MQSGMGGGKPSVEGIPVRRYREGLRQRQPSGSCFSGDGHLKAAAIDGLCECEDNKVHEVLHACRRMTVVKGKCRTNLVRHLVDQRVQAILEAEEISQVKGRKAPKLGQGGGQRVTPIKQVDITGCSRRCDLGQQGRSTLEKSCVGWRL